MKNLFLTILFAGACVIVRAQAKKSVVIGTMIDRPNAILVINPPNSDQGFLLPQLTSAQRLSISPSSPQDDGLLVFDLTEKSFYYWSGSTWIKGLGNSDNQVLSYDATTQKLTLSDNGGQVDLNTLKEIPATAGNSGKFLTTDGATLTWANISSIGDITAIIAGQGLSGGAGGGDVNLSVNTDATTISVNGSNQLQLTNNAVTTPKIAGNAVNSSHIIDGTVTSADVLDNSISTNDLADGSITAPKIAINAINTTHISSGGNDKILSTDGAGVVTWADRSSLADDDQGLNLAAGNILNIDNGTPVDLDALVAGGQITGPLNNLVVADGSITNPKLAANAVNTTNITDGSITTADINSTGNDKVLTTNGTGVVTWEDRATFTDDNQGLALVGNLLNIDNGVSADLSALAAAGEVAGPLNSLAIQPDAVNSAKIVDGSVATTDINSGGNDKVLTTNGTGTVTWADRTSFTDDNQNLGFSGNTLTIDNGTGVNLTANGQVTGLLDNLAIRPGASNQVLATDAGGTAAGWVTSGGDVTGPVAATVVGRIQGRDVSTTAPNPGDALIWNGSAWVPTVVTVGPTTQYYAVDPAAFQPLEPAAGTSTILGLFTAGGAPYVFAKGAARQIMASVNLPHGATVQAITVFYEYTLLLGPITVNFDRKPFAGGGNQVLSTVATPLLGLGVQSTAMPPVAAPVVDNFTYSYRIHVTFSNLLSSDDANGLQRIHGIRIQYSK